MDCLAGKYGEGTAAAAISDCLSCPLGTFGPDLSESESDDPNLNPGPPASAPPALPAGSPPPLAY